MGEEQQSAGDAIPAGCELIEVRVAALKQLFNAIDASPFRERDLDPDADAFIVGWAREAPRGAPLALLVGLDRDPGQADEPAALRDAIHAYFIRRARIARTRLRQLLGIGRVSFLLGLVFLATAVGLGDPVPWGEKAFSRYLGDDRAAWSAHDACELMRKARTPYPDGILVDQGLADKFLDMQLKPEAFEQACTAAAQPLTLRRHAGYDHGYYFITSFMEDHLRWHAERLLG